MKVIHSQGHAIIFNECKFIEAETKLVTGQKWVHERIAHLSWKIYIYENFT